MKRLLALALSLTLMLGACVFTLASCGKDDEPTVIPVETLESLDGKTSEEIFDEIYDSISAFTNYTLEFKSTGGGLDQRDVQEHDGNNQHHRTFVGDETYMEYWWIDDWYYMGENQLSYGSYYKGYVTWDYYLENILKTEDKATFLNYPLSWFEDLSIKKQGDNYYLEATLNGEKVNQHFNLNGGATISNVSMQINIDAKGAFKAIVLKYTQTQYGHDYHFTSTGTFTKVGTTVVEGPENPDAFTEMTIMPVK